MQDKDFDTNVRSAIVDMAKALTVVFKRYSRQSRTKAWKKLTGADGQRQMDKLLQDPSRPVNTFQKLPFKEWVEQRSQD